MESDLNFSSDFQKSVVGGFVKQLSKTNSLIWYRNYLRKWYDI